MAINRWDRPIAKDWTYPNSVVPQLPQLNFEALNSLLGQQQQMTDFAKTISDKQPQVLQTEADIELHNQYKQLVDTGLDNVSKAYLTSPKDGNRAYREYLNNVKQAWRPGGTADILNQRYTGYYAAKKQIEDQYKDDVRPVNKTLALKQLNDQLSLPINPSNGQYQQIAAPQLYKDPDIRKAINEMIKQIDDDGDTQFLGDTNRDWYIQKIKTEGRPEEKIRLAYEALSQQPEFASQIQRDAQYQAMQIDPDKYKVRFDSRVDNQLETLNSKYQEVSKGQNVKQWQEMLSNQGYDVDSDGKFGEQTKRASQEFLAEQQNLANNKKTNFDLNTELSRDVSNNYQNYAAGFASQRVDKSLIFNQAKKAQLEDRRSREKNQALLGIRDSLIQDKAPTATVTSGVAQQLPEINKHYDSLVAEQQSYKAELDKSLKDPNSVFNGWKFENVALAHNIWEDTMKNLPGNASEEQKKAAFSQALSSSGTYQWKPDELDRVYKQMSSTDGGIKPALQSYQDKQQQIERLDNARTHVAQQYKDTPEGKNDFNLLVSKRLNGESDEQLIERAFKHPEDFTVNSPTQRGDDGKRIPGRQSNLAEMFKNGMQRNIPKQKDINYDWGDMATYEVSFNADDKSFLKTGQAIGNAVENGTPYQFSSEGQVGLKFRNADGDEIKDYQGVTLGDFKIAKDVKGNPIIKYKATVKKGKDSIPATVAIDIIPGSPESEQITDGLKQAYIAKFNAGQTQSAAAVLDNISSLSGPNLADAGTQVMLDNLTKSKTKPLTDVYMRDKSGKLVPASYMGWTGLDTKNSYQMVDPQTGATMRYETYGLIDQNGKKQVANVYVAPDGTKVVKTIHSNMSSITQDRLGDNIRANTPVERETTKLPPRDAIQIIED